MNRALSKAKIKAKSEKAKRRPRTTPYNKERSAAEDNAGKYKPGRCYTCVEREATGAIAVHILTN